MRIGHGFDVHSFTEGTFIMLGGVNIPHEKGLLAHSDGDVLIHALIDALLGAAGLGDIGQHFPDSSPDYRGIDSRILLRHTVTRLKEHHYRLVNADITLVAQAPRLVPHFPAMQANLAEDLESTAINLKATTTEGLGFTGRREGIAAFAVVLLDSVI